MSIIWIFWKYLTPITTSVFALMLLLFWTTSPVPSRDELVEIDGVLASYTVEADQSKFAKFMRRQHNYVLFKLENRDGRFWSEYLGANVRTVFSHIGVPVRLYVSPNPRTYSINGDAVKTYGLFVDGSEIVSPESAVGVDSMLVRWVFPALGMILLYLAWRSWNKLARHPTQ